jgi:hypothetical protein
MLPNCAYEFIFLNTPRVKNLPNFSFSVAPGEKYPPPPRTEPSPRPYPFLEENWERVHANTYEYNPLHPPLESDKSAYTSLT